MERSETPGLVNSEAAAPRVVQREPAAEWMLRIARGQPRRVRRERRYRIPPWVNIVLFLATCVTVGAMQGPQFALTLMTILLAHEMGHYVTARRAGVEQTLPFFIPAPTLLGTLGAMIFLRTPPPNKRVLLDIAVMGPYSGLVLAIPAIAWGVANPVSAPEDVQLGGSLLFEGLRLMFGVPGGTMHPVARAGWFGVFVTSLNLIPAGQLDGGHVTYALLGSRQRFVSIFVVGSLFAFGLSLTLYGGAARLSGGVWLTWSVMLMLFGLRHPHVAGEDYPLMRYERLNAWFALAVFVMTFAPIPFKAITG
ncbi:MAG: site-2 protease family protein [Clostridia bacterium]|nr:site-2 protease family protein [Deltaproteobacteria bacterium]